MHTYIYIVISTQVKHNQNTISHNLISTLFTFENELFETKIQFPCTHITILLFQHKSNRTITCYTPRAKRTKLALLELDCFWPTISSVIRHPRPVKVVKVARDSHLWFATGR